MKEKIVMSKADFVVFMANHAEKPFAAIEAETKIDRFKGGKATAAKYGGYVIKRSVVTFKASVEYEEAVKNIMKKFGLNPEAFVAEEHKYATRYLADGKLSSVAYHKDDADKDMSERRNYLVTYVMKGCVKTKYTYTDANGIERNADEVNADLYDNTSKKQEAVGLDAEKQLIYRNYSISSIKRVMMYGYEIEIAA